MSSSPSIIYNISFTRNGKNSDRADFFRCKSSFDIIDYCDRKGAADKLPLDELERVKAFIEISKKSEKNIVDYANERPGSTGIFTKNQNFNETDKKELKDNLKNTNSIVWNSVISFTPEFARQFCNNKFAAQEIIDSCLPQLFKNSSLNYTNINWFGAFHTNTDNPHIHLVFWENQAESLDSKGKKVFSNIGKLPIKNINNFKTGIAKYLNMSALDYLPMRDEIKDEALLNFKNNKEMLNCFLRNGQSIIDDGKFQYKRLSPENQKLVHSFVEKTLAGNSELSKKYDDYKSHILTTQTELIGLHLDVHFGSVQKKTIPNVISNFYGSRIDEFDSRICNSFLKVLKNYAFERGKLNKAYQLANKNNDILKKINTGSLYARATTDKRIRIKAQATRELVGIANQLISVFFSDSSDIVVECDKSLPQYKIECIKRGESLIYEDIYENS